MQINDEEAARLRTLLLAATPDWPEPVYDNDTGPYDEGFWCWWGIEGVAKFDKEEDARLAWAMKKHLSALLDERDALRGALEASACPAPVSGFRTVAECIKAECCGCDNRAALKETPR